MHKIFIGLGSNLKNPQQKIKSAIQLIQEIDTVNLISQSSLYETPPIGFIDKPHFINAVIEISSPINFSYLLVNLLRVEEDFGRIRMQKNGPRTLDLDILLFDDLVLNSQTLTIPHPRMHERLFVLIPLLEISPLLSMPNHGSISTLIANLPTQDIKRIDS